MNHLRFFTATFSGIGNKVLTLNNDIATDLGANITITAAAPSPPTQTVAVTVSSAAAAVGGKNFARMRATKN